MSKIYKNESQLQSAIVIDFSQKKPELRGLLWATLNRSLSERDGQKQKAMGLVKGVSDLIYFNGLFIGIEVKLPGAEHSRKHIESQLDWGRQIEAGGGEYYIVTSVAGFWSVLDGIFIEGVYTTQDIGRKLEENKSKIVF